MTVDQALSAARARGLDRLDAMILLAHCVARSREWLLAHGEAQVEPDLASRFESTCLQRSAGVPVAYLTGYRDFHGLTLQVTPAVLVPRPETETLVAWALELLNSDLSRLPAPTVVDLGTGSGAIALAVAAGCERAIVTATDRSDDALQVARANAERLRVPLRLGCGDWWDAVHGAQFDLALSNPPYVASGDAHLAALQHEPIDALVAPDGGLGDIRQIIASAPRHVLRWLLIEHGWEQSTAVQEMLDEVGFQSIETRCDLSGLPRCTGGRLNDPALA